MAIGKQEINKFSKKNMRKLMRLVKRAVKTNRTALEWFQNASRVRTRDKMLQY